MSESSRTNALHLPRGQIYSVYSFAQYYHVENTYSSWPMRIPFHLSKYFVHRLVVRFNISHLKGFQQSSTIRDFLLHRNILKPLMH